MKTNWPSKRSNRTQVMSLGGANPLNYILKFLFLFLSLPMVSLNILMAKTCLKSYIIWEIDRNKMLKSYARTNQKFWEWGPSNLTQDASRWFWFFIIANKLFLLSNSFYGTHVAILISIQESPYFMFVLSSVKLELPMAHSSYELGNSIYSVAHN